MSDREESGRETTKLPGNTVIHRARGLSQRLHKPLENKLLSDPAVNGSSAQNDIISDERQLSIPTLETGEQEQEGDREHYHLADGRPR